MGVALCIATAGVTMGPADAQNYPTRPIRMIVPFATGGGTDIMARLIMPVVDERLGQRIVVENRTGGGGYIGAEVVARARPDGYTLFFTAANIVMSLDLFPKQPVDPLKDFAPVTLLTREPSLLAVHPSMRVKSVKELIALARARPGEINYASGGYRVLVASEHRALEDDGEDRSGADSVLGRNGPRGRRCNHR